MSYFELLAPSPNGPIELKAMKDPRALFALLDPKKMKALTKTANKNTWTLDPKLSPDLLIFLSQKQALTFEGKLMYPDPFNHANLFHRLSFDGTWHIDVFFQISKKNIPLKETLFHCLGRWLIHKNFIYLWEESIDRRSLESDFKLDDTLCKKWIKDPSSYPYALEFSIDETCELFEEPRTQAPTLVWMDYAWSVAKLLSMPNALSLQKDLADLGALPKALLGGGTGFFWPNHEKLYEAMQFLMESGWTIQGPKGETLHLLGPIQIEKVCRKEGEIEIRAYAKPKSPSISKTMVTGGALSHYLKKSAKYLPLNDQNWLLLPPASHCKELVQGRSQGDVVRLEPWRLQALQDFSAEYLDEDLKPWQNLFHFDDKQEMLPNFAFDLRSYQKEGLHWLINLAKVGIGGLLADEMGLGKTIQALAFIKWLHEQKPQGRFLIVTPRSLIQTWKGQIQKAFGKSVSLYIHHGAHRGQTETQILEATLTLTTYQTLRQDLTLFSSKPDEWDVALFDECHLWRNPQTQGYQTLKAIPAKMKIGLSGTPIYNSLDDLWHQLRLFAPQIVQKDPPQTPDTLFQLRPLWLRRSKEEVAPELPEKIEETLWLEMEEEQSEIYQKLLSSSLKEVEGKEASPLQILEKILRLRQCCLWPALIHNTSGIGVKAEQLLLDLETLLSEDRSVLIFSQFSGVLRPMYDLAKTNYSCHYIDSQTRDRESFLDQFEKGSPSALFMTLGTGSVGLNLTRASAVILLDPWWNESVENQAIDRTHRIGQTKNVLVRRYMIQNSLEEAMNQLKETKKQITRGWETGEASSPIELELWQKLRDF